MSDSTPAQADERPHAGEPGGKGAKGGMKMDRRHADLLLAFVSMVWGSSYLLMITAMAEVPPFELIFLRFGIAFLALVPVFPRRLAHLTRRAVLQSFATGGLIVVLFGFLLYGLETTPPSQAGSSSAWPSCSCRASTISGNARGCPRPWRRAWPCASRASRS